tara:strand:+ start:446 stop:820 length:375 start_codon:yes stop_codon:yes gene_type:complete
VQILKNSFYLLNVILIIFYISPCSIPGYLIYSDCNLQPNITKDFFLISSNHFYVFLFISLLGFLSFKNKLVKIFLYLLFISIVLELLHFVIPHRGYQLEDLLGNILGVLLSLILYKFFKFKRLK